MRKLFCTLLLFVALVSVSGCRQTDRLDSVSNMETAVISCEAARVSMESKISTEMMPQENPRLNPSDQ